MHYFIDGYNLMFRIMAGDVLQKMREDIIQDLAAKINLVSLDATVVFDAQYQNTESSRSHMGHLEIVFTTVGETADEYILEMLSEERLPKGHTVVTSDKKLAWLAKRSQANVLSVDEFIAWLNCRYKNRLRPLKKGAGGSRTASLPYAVRAPLPKVPPKFVPTASSSTEECYEFYLEKFEQEYLVLCQEKAAKKAVRAAKQKKTKKTKKPKPAKEDQDGASDMARWLKAFQGHIETDFL